MKSIFFNGKFYVERGHFEEAVLIEDGLFKVVGKTEEILEDCVFLRLLDRSSGSYL